MHAGDGGPKALVELPPVYMPMAWRRHPLTRLLEDRSMDWMERHGFCPTADLRNRVMGAQAADWMGSLCPDADVDLLQPAVDWAYLMFVFDDRHCDEEAPDDGFTFLDLFVRIIRTFEAPDAGVLDPRHAFTAPVVDLATRVHRSVSPKLVRRLVDAHRSWCIGVAWEHAARRHHRIPDLNDYLFTRVQGAAAFPTLTWLQFSEPAEVPDWELHARAVHALTEMVGTVAAIDDDLYSYGKDLWFSNRNGLESHRVPVNVVDIRIHHYGGTRDQAFAAAVTLRDRIVARFIEVRDEVLATASVPLARYLSNLTCLIRGNFEWGVRCSRYTNPDGKHPGAIATTSTVTDVPSATGAPEDAPSIAWRWRV